MRYREIRVSNDGSIYRITINDPEHLNVLGIEMIRELDGAIRELSKIDSCRAIILGGAGSKAFCAGGDLREISRLSRSAVIGFIDSLIGLTNDIEGSPKPVIAAINGYCLGGGLELALACDIRIASSGSRFGFPEVGIGIMPGGGGTYRLPSVVGMGNARYMILTGELIDSREALRIGLINAVTRKGELDSYSDEVAHTISRNSQNSIMEVKRSLREGSQYNRSSERDGFIRCFNHVDRVTGIGAFLEHRKHPFDNSKG